MTVENPSDVGAVERSVFESHAPKLGLVTAFDGMRGLGVIMVLLGHSLFRLVESWVTVVDAFFVLSGFLITTLLLQEARSTGTIKLKKFYVRRALRLFPSVWLFVTVWLVIGVVGHLAGIEEISLANVAKDGAAAVLYVYHLFFPNGLGMIEPAVQDSRYMWHLWTLSVEEWFYAVIAGTVLVCVRKRWVAQLGFLMGGAFIAIGIARWFAFTGFFQDRGSMIAGIRLAFIQRPDALMLGVGLACANAYFTAERAERWRRAMFIAINVGFVSWFVLLNLSSGWLEKLGGPYFPYMPGIPADFDRSHMMSEMYWFRFGHTLGALGFGLMVIGMARYGRWWFARAVSWNPLQWAGRLSYTLYIWHALAFVIIASVTGGADASTKVELIRTPVMIAAAIAISIPVYYQVELRALKMKFHFATSKETVDPRTGKMVDVAEELAVQKEEGFVARRWHKWFGGHDS